MSYTPVERIVFNKLVAKVEKLENETLAVFELIYDRVTKLEEQVKAFLVYELLMDASEETVDISDIPIAEALDDLENLEVEE